MLSFTPPFKRNKKEKCESSLLDISDFDNSILNHLDTNVLKNQNKVSSPISIKKNKKIDLKRGNFLWKEDIPPTPKPIFEYINEIIKTDIQLNFKDISFYGLPIQVKSILQENYNIENLYDWQKDCLKFGNDHKDQNLICHLPTSGGKTLIAELLMLKEILCNKKNALFVLPYISIVQEKVRKLSLYSDHLNFALEEYAGSKGQFPPKIRRNKCAIYIATIEKANSLIDSFVECDNENAMMRKLGIVCVDELHMIGIENAGHRAAALESLITKVKYFDANRSHTTKERIKMVGMSATLPETKECGHLPKFMNALLFKSDFRPIKLNEFVKLRNDIYQVNKNQSKVLKHARKLRWPSYYCENCKKIDPDMIFDLVVSSNQYHHQELLNLREGLARDVCNEMEIAEKLNPISCLIFCPTRKNCENVALNLTRICEILYKRAKRIGRLLKIQRRNIDRKEGKDLTKKTDLHGEFRTASAVMRNNDGLSDNHNPNVNIFNPIFSLVSEPLAKNVDGVNAQTIDVHSLRKDLIRDLQDLHEMTLDESKSDVPDRICPTLKRSLRYGIAYHHGGLTGDERRLIEAAYNKGILNVICCTSTLAAGVNLPARKVIIRSMTIAKGIRLSQSQYVQMIGRAGRPNFKSSRENYQAESFFILNDTIFNHNDTMLEGVSLDSLFSYNSDLARTRTNNVSPLFPSPRLGNLHSAIEGSEEMMTINHNPITSGMIVPCKEESPKVGQNGETGAIDDKGFRSLLLTAIGLQMANNKRQLIQLVNGTLYACQTYLNNEFKAYDGSINPVNDEKSMNETDNNDSIFDNGGDKAKQSNSTKIFNDKAWKLVRSILGKLIKSNLIKAKMGVHKNCFEVTKLGKAIYKSSIDQEHSKILYSDLVSSQHLMVLSTHLHLLHLVTPYTSPGIMEIDWTIYQSKVSKFTAHESKVIEILGITENYLLRRMTCHAYDKKIDINLVERFYRTLMLRELWMGQSVWSVSQDFKVDRGFVQGLFQNSTSFAYAVYNFTQEFDELWALKDLLGTFVKQFHHLVSKDLLPLVELPGVKIGRIRQLFNAGYKTLFQIAKAQPETLTKDIKFLSKELANQLISSAKVLIREKVETLEDEALNIISQLNIS
ncbi:unnamed protein product [Gordionus sp. m RMFG-2023]|uniref:helicase POLQ-like n=1 Tax=Gordionus sp. m RMFG-2023 TaxID=3053472 RepID=UPI0030DDF029